jgi:hypothetical protein
MERSVARHYDAAFGTRLDYAAPDDSKFRIARIDAYYLRSERSLDLLIQGRLHSYLRMRRTLRQVRVAALNVTSH